MKCFPLNSLGKNCCSFFGFRYMRGLKGKIIHCYKSFIVLDFFFLQYYTETIFWRQARHRTVCSFTLQVKNLASLAGTSVC